MKTSSLLTGLFTLALLAGCATPAHQVLHFPRQTTRLEHAGLARIYVVRPAKAYANTKLVVEADKALIGYTTPQTYLCWEQQPGLLQITSRAENADTLNLQLQPGHVYYVVQEIYPGMGSPRTHIKEVSANEGIRLVRQSHAPDVLAGTGGY